MKNRNAREEASVSPVSAYSARELRNSARLTDKRTTPQSTYFGYTRSPANQKIPYKRNPNTSVNASSREWTAASAPKPVAEGRKSDKQGSQSTSEEGQTQPAKPDSIFLTPAQNFQKLASEIIKADCWNHGYKVEKTIGEGAYAKVKLAEVLPAKLARNPDMADCADDEGTLKVAIKVIDGRSVPKEFLKKFLPRELSNHVPLPPNRHVVRVFEQFTTKDRYYVVMEYCSHGDLLDVINSSIGESRKGLGEDKVRALFRMMVEGLHHIHTNGIVHRDVKCENILLDNGDNIKITDFGFSTQFTPGVTDPLKTSCGSYAYTAPEVIKVRPYDGTKSDVWSLGIILFAMLNGRLPFNDAQLTEMEEDMKMQRLKFEKSVTFDSMVLVRRILQFNPSSRPSTAEILTDPWVTGKRASIPRQTGKSKYMLSSRPNSSVAKETGQVPSGDVTKSGTANNAMYYKSTLPERNNEATVTVSHRHNETVVLKSRTRPRKNIWTLGPPVSQRPNTWPRFERPSTATKESKQGSPTRGNTGSTIKNGKATINTKQPECNRKSSDVETKANVSTKNIQLSSWFMEQYTAAKEAVTVTHERTAACVGCQQDAGPCMAVKVNIDADNMAGNRNADVKPKSACGFDSGRYSVPLVQRPPMSMATRAKSAARCALTPAPSVKNADIVTYMTDPGVSNAERVRYFRNRLMHNTEETSDAQPCSGPNGLPSLLVQALRASPTSPSDVTGKPPPCPSSERVPRPPASRGTSVYRRASASGVRSRVKAGTPTSTTIKPKQKLIVHSSV